MRKNQRDPVNISSTRLAKAVAFATDRHIAPRKGTSIPYVSHLMSVASLVLEFGGKEDEAIAGLLHDVVEDTETKIEEVRERFGDDVAGIVAGCSEIKCANGSNIERPWRDRKDDYIAHVRDVGTSSGVLLVSMADKLHNLQCILHDYRRIGDTLWERFNAGKKNTLWFYRTLADIFLIHPNTNKSLANELDNTVTELERLAIKPEEAQAAPIET